MSIPRVAPASAERVADAAHALNRLGFGPRPGELAAVSHDVRGWVGQQLEPASLPLPAALSARLDDAAIARADPTALIRELVDHIQREQRERRDTAPAVEPAAAGAAAPMAPAASLGSPAPPASAPATPLARYVRSIQRPAIESRLLRALASPRQLEEVMVDFWFNHFNIFQGKNFTRVLVGHYEHHAIRPHVLGRFADLLAATAHHPGMLYYLDNWQSTGGAPGPQGARGLNENYARELMELHTLGVDGGYTQQDVTQLARMLTGWTLMPLRLANPGPDMTPARVPPNVAPTPGRPGYLFNPRTHDNSEKLWLGQRIAPRGKAEGDLALATLARHPATASNIAFKLAQYFVADRPDPALVQRLAQVFLAEDGQVVPVLRALFASEAFWAEAARGAKFKTPYHYSLSALRAAGSVPEALLPLAGTMAAQGMPLYGCATPDGYKNTEAAWLNPDGMSKRINFASALAARRFGGEALAGEFDAAALVENLGPLVTPTTRELAAQHRGEPVLAAALVLAGPGMMRR